MLTAKPEKQKNPVTEISMIGRGIQQMFRALNPVHVQSTAKDVFSEKEQKKKAKRIQIKVTCYSFFIIDFKNIVSIIKG